MHAHARVIFNTRIRRNSAILCTCSILCCSSIVYLTFSFNTLHTLYFRTVESQLCDKYIYFLALLNTRYNNFMNIHRSSLKMYVDFVSYFLRVLPAAVTAAMSIMCITERSENKSKEYTGELWTNCQQWHCPESIILLSKSETLEQTVVMHAVNSSYDT